MINENEKSSHRGVIDNKTRIQFLLIENGFTTLWLLIKCVFWVAIAYIVYLSIKELAGQKTVAQFILGYFTSDSSSQTGTVWFIVAALCGIWAKLERNLRLRKVSTMSDRIKELEKKIDTGRSSSGLTQSGETPLEERLP